MRRKVSGDASFKCAMDHRSLAMGTSLFTRSNISSSTPTESLRGQCMVTDMPRSGGPPDDFVVLLASASVGWSLLFIAQVMLSPIPLKRSISSPKPIGSIWVRSLQLLEFFARRDAAQAVGHAHGHLALPPDFEERLIRFRRHVVSARIHHARHAQAIQLAEKLLGAIHFLLGRRRRQAGRTAR